MKKYLLMAFAVASAFTAAMAQEAPDSAGFVFTDISVVPTNSVKDQNKSGTCWAFSATSFFEDEILRKTGKSVDLSEMFTVRETYGDKAENYVRRYGTAQFSQGGSCPDIAYVWERYGAMPEAAYPGLNYGEDNHVHGEVEAGLKGFLNAIVRKPNRRLSTAWIPAKEAILDAYFGEVPGEFVYEGVTYTPKSFAESLPINTSDYIGLTSFTHHPFYKPFNVEVPDNWINFEYYNIPLDQLVEATKYAVEHGYSVAWAADVSERGFNWGKGYANMPAAKTDADFEGTELARWVSLSKADREKEAYKQRGPVKELDVTQELRQEMFDRQETTDDHGMVIVGIAKDQEGNEWFKVKNSWTDKQIYGGYFYVSIPYFKAKTMDIYVNKEGVPANILKELGLKK
ncbi:MAG: C1 family peptidase [Pseudoflavonifractor sp.]|nr:C1 family peptidase [Alloprevotella sp.]MCM1116517.1 C1 family peptidase [Pseudoflavonifractor sp.]